jgi:hypothetical protein
MSPDPVPLSTYVDLWIVRNGHDWVTVTEEMLIDGESVLAQLTRVLAKADLLDYHYMSDRMEYRAKIKEGV